MANEEEDIKNLGARADAGLAQPAIKSATAPPIGDNGGGTSASDRCT